MDVLAWQQMEVKDRSEVIAAMHKHIPQLKSEFVATNEDLLAVNFLYTVDATIQLYLFFLRENIAEYIDDS